MNAAHANIVNDLVDIFYTSLGEERPSVVFPPALLASLEQPSGTKARKDSCTSKCSQISLNAIGVHIFMAGSVSPFSVAMVFLRRFIASNFSQ